MLCWGNFPLLCIAKASDIIIHISQNLNSFMQKEETIQVLKYIIVGDKLNSSNTDKLVRITVKVSPYSTFCPSISKYLTKEGI